MIHTADFKCIIETPALICKDVSITFSNKSIPIQTSSTWDFGVDYMAFTTGSFNITYHGFSKAGYYTIKLTKQFGTCASWDGTFKGMVVLAGSYVYTIEMTCNEKTF